MSGYSASTRKKALGRFWSGVGNGKVALVVPPLESMPCAAVCGNPLRSAEPVIRYRQPGEEIHSRVPVLEDGLNDEVLIFRSFLNMASTRVLKLV